MIRELCSSTGEHLIRAGNFLKEEADSIRVEYGNPRELPERFLYDTVGERFQFIGNKLIELANKDEA
jgi:hypothetical protein